MHPSGPALAQLHWFCAKHLTWKWSSCACQGQTRTISVSQVTFSKVEPLHPILPGGLSWFEVAAALEVPAAVILCLQTPVLWKKSNLFFTITNGNRSAKGFLGQLLLLSSQDCAPLLLRGYRMWISGFTLCLRGIIDIRPTLPVPSVFYLLFHLWIQVCWTPKYQSPCWPVERETHSFERLISCAWICPLSIAPTSWTGYHSKEVATPKGTSTQGQKEIWTVLLKFGVLLPFAWRTLSVWGGRRWNWTNFSGESRGIQIGSGMSWGTANLYGQGCFSASQTPTRHQQAFPL